MLHRISNLRTGARRLALNRASCLTLWVGGIALLIYAATTARHVLPADSGEFQLVAAEWGIAHPPGYPLYTLASALWTWLLPFGAQPFRTSLLSAVLAATTLALTFRATVVWAQALGTPTRRACLSGLAASLALGAAATFWSQATLANIRMPTLLFAAWSYLALAHYRAALGDQQRQDRALAELALAAGLGIGHHPSLAFVALGWGLYLLLLTPRLLIQPARWWRPAALAALAWALPQLYLPLRGSMAGVALDPSGLATWRGFWDHVLARGFGGDMFAFVAPYYLALRAPLLPSLFRMQFPVPVLIAMVIGELWLLVRSPRAGLALLTSWAVQSFVTITYRAPQTVEYLMPAYIPMALALGLALALWQPARKRLPGLLWTALCLILLAQLPGRVRDFGALANDTSVRDRVLPLLQQGAVLADWRWATPLWVLQATEAAGADTDVVYVLPEDNRTYEDVWRGLAESAGDAPLYTTHAYDWADWVFAPVGGGFRLYRRPLAALPADLGFVPLEADLGPIRLLGYHWYGDLAPGSTVELQLAWSARQTASDQELTPSFATRLWAADGSLVSDADRQLAGDLASGEIQFTRLTHQIPPYACPGELAATVAVYVVEAGAFRDLGQVALPPAPTTCRLPKLPTQRAWPGVVLGNGPFLRGVDYDTRSDGNTTIYLHWCGPGAALVIQHAEGEVRVKALKAGECQTVPVVGAPPGATLTDLVRPDGSPARYLGLPLPQPRQDERYLPFGDEMVLVGDHHRDFTLTAPDLGDAEGESLVLSLVWRTATPLIDDYAVSVRLLDPEGNWLGMHDMQPGLGAIPTLKWVARGDRILDPHPLAGLQRAPDRYAVVVYERFRLTTLRSAQGDSAVYKLR